jgi:hypothetical protein
MNREIRAPRRRAATDSRRAVATRSPLLVASSEFTDIPVRCLLLVRREIFSLRRPNLDAATNAKPYLKKTIFKKLSESWRHLAQDSQSGSVAGHRRRNQ